MGLLTIEQAMADYALLIQYLKESLNATHSPVITFGGRYDSKKLSYQTIWC